MEAPPSNRSGIYHHGGDTFDSRTAAASSRKHRQYWTVAMSKRRTPRRNPKTGRFVSARRKPARGRSTARRGGRTRANPYVGDIVEIQYDPHDGDPRPFRHKAGDRGRLLPKGKPAKLYVDKRTGKPSIRGDMRWINGVGLIG